GKIFSSQFTDAIPELNDIAHVEFDSFAKVSSTRITTAHWIGLREKIIHYLNVEKFDGVVITHGTNTIEETAYFLHLTVPTEKPIVCVGAQRPFSALSSDAQLN